MYFYWVAYNTCCSAGWEPSREEGKWNENSFSWVPDIINLYFSPDLQQKCSSVLSVCSATNICMPLDISTWCWNWEQHLWENDSKQKNKFVCISNFPSLKTHQERKTIPKLNVDISSISNLFLICFLLFHVQLFLLCLGKPGCFRCVKKNDYSGTIQENTSILVVSFFPQIGNIFSCK